MWRLRFKRQNVWTVAAFTFVSTCSKRDSANLKKKSNRSVASLIHGRWMFETSQYFMMILLWFSMKISVLRYRCPLLHGRWMSENIPYLIFHDDFTLLLNENFILTLPLPPIHGRSRFENSQDFMVIFLCFSMNISVWRYRCPSDSCTECLKIAHIWYFMMISVCFSMSISVWRYRYPPIHARSK